jgi:DNA-binding response OmpR family regulator
MAKALIYHMGSDISQKLRADLKSQGWSIDSCEGMLEMLRLIDRESYEVVVLNTNRLGMEICVLVGTIEALKKKPKILLSLPEAAEYQSLGFPAFGFPVIRGDITPAKFMEAARESV